MSDQTPEFDAMFSDLHQIAQTLTTDDYLRESPPPDVWNKIAAGVNHSDHRSQMGRPAGRAPLVLAAAAAIVLLVVIGSFAARALRSGSTAEVAGGAELVNTDLPVVSDATAAVELLLDDDGSYRLDIDLSAIPDSGDGVLELWIIDENVESMFSLGAIDGDGRFDLPPGVDPADFPIVDISVEPLDGDPTHSGQSVLRGVLDQT